MGTILVIIFVVIVLIIIINSNKKSKEEKIITNRNEFQEEKSNNVNENEGVVKNIINGGGYEEESIPDKTEEEISRLKKKATKNKKKDLEKSVNYLMKAKEIQDKYYLDTRLDIRIAKYLTKNKKYDEAFRFLQNTIDKISIKYFKNSKYKYYGEMKDIADTTAYIIFYEDRIKTSYFYKLKAMGFQLVFYSLGMMPLAEDLDFEMWYKLNTSDRIAKGLIKETKDDTNKKIKEMLKDIFNQYSSNIINCHKILLENYFEELEINERKEVNEKITEIEKIPSIIREKFNNEIINDFEMI